jgi:recombination protein RecR
MLPERLRRVIELLARLPGVGEKTAQRFGLYLASEPNQLATELGQELLELTLQVRQCERCRNLAEVVAEERVICSICSDRRRDEKVLCVVHRVQDLLAIERSGAMRGRYFVLGRLLSPLDGVGPDELPLAALIQVVREDSVREVILATPPSVDGEATALLIARELASHGVSMTRIASGVPHGGDLEFSDQVTLGRAIDGRRAIR